MGNFFKYIILIVFVSIVNILKAQEYSIKAKVVDSENNSLTELVVCINELNKWTYTDANGGFEFHSIPKGEYEIIISSLHFSEKKIKLKIKDNIFDLLIVLEKKSLALKEITVTAENNKRIYSSSIINQGAIEHLQASSLEDILQLVPGHLSTNPSLKDENTISLREVTKNNKDADETSSLGTAIFIDGARLNNDANLQFLSTANILNSLYFKKHIASGYDLRSIPSSNIESVEIIRGVASAEYGEMLTGAVLVKTKAGYSPFNLAIKTDPNTKSISMGQGFILAKDRGVFNYDFDYTRYVKDLRSDASTYDRYNTNLRYSQVFNKKEHPLSLNIKTNITFSNDINQNDRNALAREKNNYKERSFGLNIFGDMYLDNFLLTNLKYSFNTSYSHSETQILRLQSLNGLSRAAYSALETSEYVAPLLEREYYSDLAIDGKPFNINAKLSASLVLKDLFFSNKLLYGLEYNYLANVGDGKSFDYMKPFNPGTVNAIRPRSFKDIPSTSSYSIFVENRLSIPLNEKKLELQFGIRINKYFLSGAMTKENQLTFEPRLNTEFFLFKSLSLRAALGINYKNPSIAYLYPDKLYIDKETFNNGELFIASTKVIDDVANIDIKPSKNTKKEIGLDFRKWGMRASLTAFKENMTDCFSFYSLYNLVSYNKYSLPSKNSVVKYNDKGELSFDGIVQTATSAADFNLYNRPENSYSIYKKGIEYSIDFGRIKNLNTSLAIDGAYIYNEKTEEIPFYENTNSSIQKDFIGIYPKGKKDIAEIFNSSFRIVTHIPELRMVFSLTAQVIWFEKYQSKYDKTYYSEDGKALLVNPIACLDSKGQIRDISNLDVLNSEYKLLIRNENITEYQQEIYPISSQLNFKLSKEIGDSFNLSFYVNNLLNYIQRHKLSNVDSYVYRNQSLFFGAMLKITL